MPRQDILPKQKSAHRLDWASLRGMFPVMSVLRTEIVGQVGILASSLWHFCSPEVIVFNFVRRSVFTVLHIDDARVHQDVRSL